MAQKSIRRGKFYRLTEDIGPIPAGVYRCGNADEEIIMFNIKNKAIFGFDTRAQSKLKALPFRQGKRRQTPIETFSRKYYKLLENLKGKPFSWEKLQTEPQTFCAIDESVALAGTSHQPSA